ncbi:MAG TPA: F0F1 ATP synthase subunit B [Smithella sp.]|nr:F0F1 ATP synthase subunit B [Smithella sp.]
MKKTISSITAVLFILLVAAGFAFAAEAEGANKSMELLKGLGLKTFNFVVLVGFLYWLLAAKIKDFFSGRRVEIKESLEQAVERKAEAEKKYREYSEKLDKASLEIDGIFEMIKAQGVTEKQKIIEDAEKTAKKMKEDASARIEQEMKKATDQLKAQAVELSVQMAEEILKRSITKDDHKAMVEDYINKVVIKH